MKFYVYRDPQYTPCSFLLVKEGADPYSDNPKDTVLIQFDWDWASIARAMGMDYDDDMPSPEVWDYIMDRAVRPGQKVEKNNLFEAEGYFSG
jgi:hypothetical protein